MRGIFKLLELFYLCVSETFFSSQISEFYFAHRIGSEMLGFQLVGSEARKLRVRRGRRDTGEFRDDGWWPRTVSTLQQSPKERIFDMGTRKFS